MIHPPKIKTKTKQKTVTLNNIPIQVGGPNEKGPVVLILEDYGAEWF